MLGRPLAAACALLALAACDDDSLLCTGPFVVLRNPTNLACVPFQLADGACPDIPPPPAWAICKHPCETIRDEAACAQAIGCRIAREECGVFDDRCQREGPFLGCFPVDTATTADGACQDLDAAGCATRDDCGAQYVHGPDCPVGEAAAAGAAVAPRPDGPDCHFSFTACYDELDPPP
ncbi:MAG TPA: hypothetical protein VHE35_34060 [Kofleriaceae bacterium]|nr:hypothetical protein [Kofleriaceae bacterium]